MRHQSYGLYHITIWHTPARRYSTVVAELLPTPAKTHYLFNLRDLSKVFQGMSAAGAGAISSKSKLLRLWVHEVRARERELGV